MEILDGDEIRAHLTLWKPVLVVKIYMQRDVNRKTHNRHADVLDMLANRGREGVYKMPRMLTKKRSGFSVINFGITHPPLSTGKPNSAKSSSSLVEVCNGRFRLSNPFD